MGNHAATFQVDRSLADSHDIPGGVSVTFPPIQDTVCVNDRSMTFHELYSRYAGDVYRFAHWLTGDPDAAQDITSETFVRAWTAPNEPRSETVKAYLFAIARNLHRKHFRRQAHHDPIEEALPDPAATPDQVAVTRDEFLRTLAALQQLPELDRTVLLLKAQDGLAYEEIAALTGLSIGAAKVRVFRARAKLVSLLEHNTTEIA
jgi:RNA polymerase sigma-70 factor (ECF subfamily)